MVLYIKTTKPSGMLLEQRLREAGYNGPDISWGKSGEGLNGKVTFNKREALEIMAEAGVPTPRIYYDNPQYPCVGRRDYHRKARGYFYCEDQADYDRTRRFKLPPSHYLEFIEAEHEFRVHVVLGKAIKLSQKTREGGAFGWPFFYPWDFKYKLSLEKVAIDAVAAVKMDFGAVDILWKPSEKKRGDFYVLEVNSAPCLTSLSDTLDRYVTAFLQHPPDLFLAKLPSVNLNFYQQYRGW